MINDIFDPVYAAASYMSKCALRQCCRHFSESAAPPRFIDVLTARLPPDILDMITRTGGIISGGFILACLNDHEYGDIDIIYGTDNEHGRKLLISLMGEKWESTYEFNKTGVVGAHDSKKFIMCGHTINYIRVFSAADHIDSYDFDICKVWFDGRLHMTAPDSVATMTCNGTRFIGSIYFALYSSSRGLDRAAKYAARGYNMGKFGAAEAYDTYNEIVKLQLRYNGKTIPVPPLMGALENMQKHCSHRITMDWKRGVLNEIESYFVPETDIVFPDGPGCAWCGYIPGQKVHQKI